MTSLLCYSQAHTQHCSRRSSELYTVIVMVIDCLFVLSETVVWLSVWHDWSTTGQSRAWLALDCGASSRCRLQQLVISRTSCSSRITSTDAVRSTPHHLTLWQRWCCRSTALRVATSGGRCWQASLLGLLGRHCRLHAAHARCHSTRQVAMSQSRPHTVTHNIDNLRYIKSFSSMHCVSVTWLRMCV